MNGTGTELVAVYESTVAAVAGVVPDAVQSLLILVLHVPLMHLYLRGPSWCGLGFWAGAEASVICASMAPGTSAAFWQEHQQACRALITKRFQSWVVLIYVPVYYAALVGSLWALFWWLYRCRHRRRPK